MKRYTSGIEWKKDLLKRIERDNKIKRYVVCMICGSKTEIVISNAFYEWNRKHGIDGSEHGFIDTFLRLIGIRNSVPKSYQT